MRLYEYAIYYVPTDDDGNVKRDECKILVPPTTCLAKDEKTVGMKAAKEIPDEIVDLDFVNIAVRPF